MSHSLLDKNENLRTMRLLVRRLEDSNSILTGLWFEHTIIPAGPFPAWSDGARVTFVSDYCPDLGKPQGITQLKGLNNHEVGHAIFTPTLRDMANTWNRSGRYDVCQLLEALATEKRQSFLHTWNILEDQRQEGLLVRRYRSMRPFLIAAYLHFVVNDADALELAHLLTRGRKYLPLKLRKIVRRSFKRQDLVATINEIIDEYIKLNLYKADHLKRAYELTIELETLLTDNDILPKDQPCGVADHIHETASKSSSSDEDQVDRLLAIKVPGQPDDNQDGDDSQGSNKPSATDVVQVVSEVAKDVQRQERVRTEVREAKDYLKSASPISTEAKKVTFWRDQVPVDLPPLARKVANELHRVEADTDPHWLREQSHGRVDVQRLVRGDDLNTVFNRWDDGGVGGNDIEMAVLLDVSGSMGSEIANLNEAAWVVKRAADLVKAKATIFTYDDLRDYKVVYGPNDRADMHKYPSLPLGGYTEPGLALVEAHAVLVNSKRARKLLLLMTDGTFTNHQTTVPSMPTPDSVIEDLNKRKDVTTALVFMGSGSGDHHKCQVYETIASMAEFPAFVKKMLVKQMIGAR